MDNTKEHNDLIDDILLYIGSRPDVRLWKRVVGFDFKRKIKYGIPGEPDIVGIIFPSGRMLCIEVKTGKGKLEPNQIKRKKMLIHFGALYIEARSLEQTIREFNEKI